MISSVTNQVHFGNNPQNIQDRKQKQEQVATGVGGAAGITASATRYAGKKGLKANAGEQLLAEMSSKVNSTIRTVNQSQEVKNTLIGAFKENLKMYTNSIMKQLAKFKDSKFIGPIIKSPVTKKLSTVAGGALAFFVLVTGLNKACKSGKIAVDDLKEKLNEYKSA